ncbi:MAG: methyltransferase [Gammaproteobacteria bacterium]
MNVFTRIRHLIGQAWLGLRRHGSGVYWESRYRLGMTSGSGSMGELARFKARVLNDFVREQGVESVIEFGCGDGLQLALAEYPRYLGVDVSRTAVELCRRRFAGDATKTFLWLGDPERGAGEALPGADLALSLDVIYHLVEDEVYRRYLDELFGAARRHVIIYSSNREDLAAAAHVRHRAFLREVQTRFPEFRMVRKVDNPLPKQSFADFYVFSRVGDPVGADSRRR